MRNRVVTYAEAERASFAKFDVDGEGSLAAKFILACCDLSYCQRYRCTRIELVSCTDRASAVPYLYRARNLVKRFFSRIKQCRRVAISMTSASQTTSPSSNWHQSEFDYALMSARADALREFLGPREASARRRDAIRSDIVKYANTIPKAPPINFRMASETLA
jgi:transposase